MWESYSPGEIKADSETVGFTRHGSLETTRGNQASDKGKDSKSDRKMVDGEPPGLGRGQWELEKVAHEDVCHWWTESSLPREHLTLWGMENHVGMSPTWKQRTPQETHLA